MGQEWKKLLKMKNAQTVIITVSGVSLSVIQFLAIVRTGRGPAIGREEYGRLREALLSCVTTDEAVGILKERGLDGPVLEEMTGRIKTVLEAWSHGGVQAETIVFSNKWGELGRTARARAFMEEVRTFGRQE